MSTITLSRLGWSTPDGRRIFSDLDLQFRPERTGIVGRNGVGKSTLLRLIAGEATPTNGAIRRNRVDLPTPLRPTMPVRSGRN